MHKDVIRLITLLSALFGATLSAQHTSLLPLNRPAAVESVDVLSYPGMLLLSHTINLPFVKLPKNPVFQASNMDWDSEDVADPYIVQTPDSLLLFYSGSSRSDERYSIGYAVRDAQGWFWIRRGKIIAGSGQDWDSYHRIAPVVLREDSRWRLFYSGNADDTELGYQWGMATATGLKQWQYHNAPILTSQPDAWDAASQIYGDVHFFPAENTYKMWYTGFQGPLSSIGLATSRDGLRWEQSRNQPVFSRIPGVIAPDVLFHNGQYVMYFAQAMLGGKGLQTKICRAFSPDGINWKNAEDVLLPTDRWEKGQLMRPHLAYFEGRVYLYYCGGAGSWEIGAAHARPSFAAQGKWQAELPANARSLSIAYEQPPGTTIGVYLVGRHSKQRMALDFNEPYPTLRKGVFRKDITLPDIVSIANTLYIELTTENSTISPVIYEIRIEE